MKECNKSFFLESFNNAISSLFIKFKILLFFLIFSILLASMKIENRGNEKPEGMLFIGRPVFFFGVVGCRSLCACYVAAAM